MWDPFFPHLRREKAVLRGYHREFVMSFARVWGRPEAPCVVLGLEPGDQCEGVAYEVEVERLPDIEAQLRAFEGEAFEVTRRTILVEGKKVEATVALNRPAHADYLGQLPRAKRASMARRARGPQGTCLEYVARTAEALERWGIEDRHVLRFLRLVERAQGEG